MLLLKTLLLLRGQGKDEDQSAYLPHATVGQGWHNMCLRLGYDTHSIT